MGACLDRSLCTALCAVVVAAASWSGIVRATAQGIGTAAAVNPRSTGTPPARPMRVLEIGASLVRNERISTSASGSLQVLLADKTTIALGPGSDLVLDQFVYDPQRGTGQMTAGLARGVLRFVGGNISHSGGATFQTPVATLGIRGGAMGLRHSGGVTEATLQYGTMTVTTAWGSVVVRRPGFKVVVGPSGLSGPFRAGQPQVDRLFAETTSRPGQTGGLRQAGRIPALRLGSAGVTPCLPGLQRQTLADYVSSRCPQPRPDLVRQGDEIVRGANQIAADRAVIPLQRPQPSFPVPVVPSAPTLPTPAPLPPVVVSAPSVTPPQVYVPPVYVPPVYVPPVYVPPVYVPPVVRSPQSPVR
jgi:hypothetical protein